MGKFHVDKMIAVRLETSHNVLTNQESWNLKLAHLEISLGLSSKAEPPCRVCIEITYIDIIDQCFCIPFSLTCDKEISRLLFCRFWGPVVSRLIPSCGLQGDSCMLVKTCYVWWWMPWSVWRVIHMEMLSKNSWRLSFVGVLWSSVV